eukprot:g4111.t1
MIVTDELQLREDLRVISSGDSIYIDTDSIHLHQTLVVTTNNVTIRGRGRNQTVLRCPENSQSAIIISGRDIRIESMSLTGCSNASAVIVDGRNQLADAEISASFVNVGFIQNGKMDCHVTGAGVRIDSCRGNNCARPNVTVKSCAFEDNAAAVGGAIYGTNCEMRISESTFTNNSVLLSGGAVFLNERSPRLEIQSCTFTNNRATSISINEPSAVFRGALSASNTTIRGGGALFLGTPLEFLVRDSVFNENSAGSGGGAIRLKYEDSDNPLASSVNASIQNTTFCANNVHYSNITDTESLATTLNIHNMGGALFILSQSTIELQLSVANSIFKENSAYGGGAAYIHTASETLQSIRNCRFIGNVADSIGGAIVARLTFLSINGTRFIRNQARLGGGVHVSRDCHLIVGTDNYTDNVTVFEYNTALDGAGMQALLQVEVDLEGVVFQHNLAIRSAGALRAYSTLRSINVRGVLFENNTALVGGAISSHSGMELILDEYNGVPTRLINNSAILGGGLFRRRGILIHEHLLIRNTVLKNNRAFSSEDSTVAALFGSITQNPFFQTIVNETRERIPMSFTVENVYQHTTNSPDGHGGGFMIETEDLSMHIIAEIVFENVTMIGNQAVVGGGGSLRGTTSFWNVEKRLHCFPASFGVDSCQKLLFQNVIITENKAEYAGGLFVSRPETIMLTCNKNVMGVNRTLVEVMQARLQSQNEFLDFKDDLLCTSIHSNEISDGADVEGADVGSLAASLHLENSNGTLKVVSSGERLSLSCTEDKDKECSRSVIVAVKDAFNQTISRGIDDANLDLTLSSQNVIGDLRYTAINGTVNISNTSAWGVNVPSAKLIIHSTQNESIRVEVNFSTRACAIGQYFHDTLCSMCPPDQYGFNASEMSCTSCEINAVCEGGAALVPIDGYWHSTPFSPQFHSCFLPKACTYENRDKNLTHFYADTDQLQELLNQLDQYIEDNEELPDFSAYKQCDDGYEGVLCGSCEEGYGRAINGECSKCPKREISITLGVISFITAFAIVGVNAAITIFSSRARIRLVHLKLGDNRRNKAKPPLKRTESHIRAETVTEIQEHREAVNGLSSNVTDAYINQLLEQKLIATIQFTELLKILLNHMQITAAALRIRVEWDSAINGLLSAEATLSGITSDVFSAPFECHFHGTDVSHPSISAFWFRILTPMTVLCTLILVFSIIWLLIKTKRAKRNESRNDEIGVLTSWRTGVIIVVIVAVYFTFIDIVRELLRTVNCVNVDRSYSENSGNPYNKYAIETDGTVWVEDTNEKCFRGVHFVTSIVGIIGLVASVMLIVFIIVWLPLNKKHRKDPDFIARYWFLYQGYKMEWYTYGWESAILTRKALIAAVIVFAVHLGPSLQATLCVGILVVALMIQTFLSPYIQEDTATNVPDYFGQIFEYIKLPSLARKWVNFSNSADLNGLESASLLFSITVFLYAVVLNDPNTSEYGKVLFGGVTALINGLYLLFMVYKLYAGIHLIMDLRLEVADPSYLAFSSNGPSLRNFCLKALHIMKLYYREYRNTSQDVDQSHSSEGIMLTPLSVFPRSPPEIRMET